MFYDDSICVILRHLFYEYHYSPHKLAFQNIMRAGDQKLMIDLEWPYIIIEFNFRWGRDTHIIIIIIIVNTLQL